MKQVYDALKYPIYNRVKKFIIKEGVKAVDVLTQETKILKIEGKIDISQNQGWYDEQKFAYKPSIIQQKINDDFNYANNQFGIRKLNKLI